MSHYRSHITPDHAVAQNATVINSAQQMETIISSSGPVLFFGDEHSYHAGPKALADLMPTLAQHNTKILALELPVQLNGFLKKLQHDIPTKQLSTDQIFDRLTHHREKLEKDLHLSKLDNEFSKADLDLFSKISQKNGGGDQGDKDIAKLIKAATHNNIRVVGIDPRTEINWQREHMKLLLDTYKSGSPDKAITFAEHLRSKDAKAAANLQRLAGALPTEAKTAVMYGSFHGCLGLEHTTSLVQSLTKAGIDVTRISLASPKLATQDMPSGICPAPTTHVIDAPKLSEDVHKNQAPRQNPKPAAIVP